MNERRKFRRLCSLLREEDVVLLSMNRGPHFTGKLRDISHGGALVYDVDPTVWAEVGHSYKLYFESRRQMIHVEGTLVRKNLQFLAFQFVNFTLLDLHEIRSKLARMEILAARMFVGE